MRQRQGWQHYSSRKEEMQKEMFQAEPDTHLNKILLKKTGTVQTSFLRQKMQAQEPGMQLLNRLSNQPKIVVALRVVTRSTSSTGTE